jgi:hypothetical protein
MKNFFTICFLIFVGTLFSCTKEENEKSYASPVPDPESVILTVKLQDEGGGIVRVMRDDSVEIKVLINPGDFVTDTTTVSHFYSLYAFADNGKRLKDILYDGFPMILPNNSMGTQYYYGGKHIIILEFEIDPSYHAKGYGAKSEPVIIKFPFK